MKKKEYLKILLKPINILSKAFSQKKPDFKKVNFLFILISYYFLIYILFFCNNKKSVPK